VARKYGLIIEQPAPEDYVLGASKLPTEVLQENRDWTPYLPLNEYQNLNGIEPYSCVPFTILNCVETLIKRKYGEERNYSDRFLATVINTRDKGCSPKEAAEFLRKIGVVGQLVWPFDQTIDTEDKFFTKLPPKLYQLAQDFNKEWDFGYEYVPSEKLEEAIQYSPLLISVYAWIQDEQGYYYRPYGMQDIHATSYIKAVSKEYRLVFDSYDSALKKVRWDAVPMIAMRFYIQKKEQPKSFWRELYDEFGRCIMGRYGAFRNS
jgi:hypothetical protein